MRKFSIYATFAGICAFLSHASHAAYPIYQGGIPNGQMIAMPQQQMMVQQPVMYVPQLSNRAISTAAAMNSRHGNAASANRITGALPRVGSNATNAGRQYYQASDYDRLADSGLYIGLSAAYAISVMGDMSADYQNEQNAFFVPGAFKPASFNYDSVIPLQISVGAAINNDMRIDFSYLRYTGLGYNNTAETSDGGGGYVQTKVDGGAITANTTMLNIYYNIDSYTGYLAGGSLRPYVGAGIGVSLNTIADYVVYDKSFYSEMDPAYAGAGDLTAISDVTAYHNGGTTEQFAFMLEGGLTTELNGGIKMDFYVRYTNLGRVKTSGSNVVSQVEWLSDGAGSEYEAPYDSVFHYTNWYESGRLSTVDLGVRARLQY